MNPTCHIAVIADDITGAADTGVQFCPAAGPIYMAGADRPFGAGEIATAGVAVFTNTRHADAATAAARVRRAAARIRVLAPQVVYKKIDSCLRGNLGAEIEALLQATGKTASFVAPALPQQGRTTVDDCHRIHGVPVAATEIGRDPLCPVRESRLSVRLSAQSRLPVGHVDLACLEAGGESIQRVRSLLGQGCRHIVFDAARTTHLDTIASLVLDRFENVLPVGSAGLAASLSRILGRQLPSPAIAQRPTIQRWLVVCGSASQVLARQVAMLVRAAGWNHWSLDPSALIDGRDRPCAEGARADGVNARRTGGLIVSIKPIPEEGPIINPDQVVHRLADVAAALLKSGEPQGVFLSGGDTAEAFWQRIGASALLIREEILPGLVRGEFVGGPFAGLPVVTKAGAFGQADTLYQLINSMK